LLDRQLNVVCHLDSKGMLKRWYPAVLNDGFDFELNPMFWKELQDQGMKEFNTTWPDAHLPLYPPAYISAKGKWIFVTLGGIKPFGILDAIVVNAENGKTSYMKQPSRSALKEITFRTDETQLDLNVVVTFHGKYMFMCRPVRVEKGGVREYYSIIQKHELKEKM
jgi:hypothetical protein